MSPIANLTDVSSFPPLDSIPLDASVPVAAGCKDFDFKDGGVYFNFQLRLADEVGLGIQLAPKTRSTGESMIIRYIQEHGAISSWNRVCFDGSTHQYKVVWPGDAIVCVNGKTEYEAMVQECKASMLLKLTIFRQLIGPDSWYWSTGEVLDSCKPSRTSIEHSG
jgi:hypothetical protein